MNMSRQAMFSWLYRINATDVVRELKDMERIAELPSKGSQLREAQVRRQRALFGKIRDIPAYAWVTDATRLRDFPSVNKATLRQSYDTYARLDSHSGGSVRYTSGSSGQPFRILQSSAKRCAMQAETLFYNAAAGCLPGDPLLILRASTDYSRLSPMKKWLTNVREIDVRFFDDESIRALMEDIASYRTPPVIVSYASTLDAIAGFIRDTSATYGGDPPKSFVATSEALADQTRDTISSTFACPCLSRYSNMEQGFIAQQAVASQNLVVNEAHYYVEALQRDVDIPVPDGQVGRLVITDYFNERMPFIRYDTGDLGVLGYETIGGTEKRVIKSIEGRQIDMVYDTRGVPVSPHQVSVAFWKLDGIRQFQFTQLDEGVYDIQVVPLSETLDARDLLDRRLRAILGDDAKMTFRVVDRIPPLPSGKHRYVANAMSRTKG